MAPRPVPPDQIKAPPTTIGIQEGRGGSTPAPEILLEEIKRVRLAPGDVLVLRVKDRPPEERIARIVEQMKSIFPDHRAVILRDGMELEVAGPEASA